MVSNTKQTETMRARRHKNMGRRRKRLMAKRGTPAFPIHPEGAPSADLAPGKPAHGSTEGSSGS
jgi:hypothetical protein